LRARGDDLVPTLQLLAAGGPVVAPFQIVEAALFGRLVPLVFETPTLLVGPAGLRGPGVRHLHLPLQILPARSAPLEARIKAICETRVRYGYRRVQVPLQRKDRVPATRQNDVWATDLAHDQLATGRKIRVLTTVDTFSRFSPLVDPRFSYRAKGVVTTLQSICSRLGYPRTIRVNQGSEFISRDLDLWAYARGATLDFSLPGKPADNAFNGRFRSECLNVHWFLTLAVAAEKMEAWLRSYNEDRPHGAIGNKPPILLQNPGGMTSPPPRLKAGNSTLRRSNQWARIRRSVVPLFLNFTLRGLDAAG